MPRSGPWVVISRTAICALGCLGTSMVVSGCSANNGVYIIAPDRPPQLVPPGSELLPSGQPDYHVSPLDVLQIEVYPAQPRQTLIDYGSQIRIVAELAGQSYAIAPGDTLSIEIDPDNQNGEPVIVRPDGRITLAHLARDIRAAGLTPGELTAAITDAYAATMKAPQVTVSVLRSNSDALARVSGIYQVGMDGQIVVPVLGSFFAVGEAPNVLARRMEAVARDRFRNPVRISASLGQLTGRDVDVRVDPGGRSFFRNSVKVSPDGKIFIQPAGLVRVVGLPLGDVRHALINALQPLYANPIDVSVGLAESSKMSVFVGGEVHQPGRYAYAESMTLLQLVTMSGWITDVGDITRVLLLHPAGPGRYTVYRSNLAEVLDHGAVAQDLSVAPQDIVVVPTTTIGDVDKFVDQYIRRVLPFTATAGYSYITNPVGNNTVTTPVTKTSP